MSDRTRAISILKKARDILIDRLAERVVEAEERILEEAVGLSYAEDINDLYEQLGLRLTQVQGMLAQLPSSEELPLESANIFEFASPAPVSGAFVADTSQPPFPFAPATDAQARQDAWDALLRHVEAESWDEVRHALPELLGVDESRAELCLVVLREQSAANAEMPARLVKLRGELHGGSWNSALALLWECFGLQGFESIAAIETLRHRLGRVSERGK